MPTSRPTSGFTPRERQRIRRFLGRVGMLWAGAWSGGETYAPGIMVYHGGVLYVSIIESLSIEPGVTLGWASYWDRVQPDAVFDSAEIAGPLTLDETVDPGLAAANTGELHAEDVAGFTNLHINYSDVKVQLHSDSLFIAKNTSGITLNKGDVVAVTGSTGQRPEVARADAAAADHAVGLVMASTANNAWCRVMRGGLLTGIDTSSWAAGTILYMGSTPGQPSSTSPSHPLESQVVGNVIYQHAVNGIILVDTHETTRHSDGTHEDLFYIGSSATDRAVLSVSGSTLTGSRTYTFPDASGELALAGSGGGTSIGVVIMVSARGMF